MEIVFMLDTCWQSQVETHTNDFLDVRKHPQRLVLTRKTKNLSQLKLSSDYLSLGLELKSDAGLTCSPEEGDQFQLTSLEAVLFAAGLSQKPLHDRRHKLRAFDVSHYPVLLNLKHQTKWPNLDFLPSITFRHQKFPTFTLSGLNISKRIIMNLCTKELKAAPPLHSVCVSHLFKRQVLVSTLINEPH